ncbi:ABC transporter ATP-binding protein [Pseudoalteromonas sp. MMG010]|uniref:ABC transporter ATP-binding protein n=1 Tax=Pseudoalteromonas sp. MMG010 TaxID=2822685 RepID=UPI001B3A111D|nr:ABC transporter ATP-binding protein [Pseudoalteromonas sp. MMG010]
MQQKNTVVAVENISFQYPKAQTLSVDDISFSLHKGSCTAILGPNGAGKSTLISLLCGLLNATFGSVKYLSYPTLSLSQAIKQKVALVPQDFAFYDELSVLDNLAFFVSISEKNTAKHTSIITNVLAQCELENVAKQRSGTLSGGYKRRLNIAIALSKQPDIIFLDEPTVGIDPLSRDSIIRLLIKLKEQGKTLVYTSHLLHEVAQLCDNVVFIRQGKLVAHEALSQQQLSLTFTTYRVLSKQQLRAFNNVECVDTSAQYRVVANNAKQLSEAFLALGQLTDELKTVSFSDNYIEQLYRELFTEVVC